MSRTARAAALLLLVLPAALAALAGCEARSLITAAEMRAHVTYLASDDLDGRETGTPGIAAAERYIAGELARSGLKPLPGRETFFVDFVLYRHTYDPTTTALAFARGEERTTADLGVGFRPFWFSRIGRAEARVVFAGYGITAPEHGWDDYEGLDARGRIVLVLRHEPAHDEPASRFAGKEYTRHALFVTKARNALAHGAAGLILFTDPASSESGADDLRVSGNLSLDPTARAGGGETVPLLAAHVSRDIAAWLVAPSGHSLESLQKAVDSGTRPREISLGGLTASMAIGGSTAAAQEVAARNVAGFLRGGDPELADEWIVVGAHHDHLGSIPRTAGDGIFNGADDNASGVSAVLELAERFAAMRPAPARSIVFMTFSAEEAGLFGSRAVFERDLLPRQRIRFMLNLDMIGRNAEEPVRVSGQGVDERLRAQLEAAAEALDLKWTFAGSGPGSANSDYGPFMEAGIPFLSFFTGEHADYHEVSDHADRLEYRRMEHLVRWVAEALETIASRRDSR